ncbi:hypothetical protein [Azotobacter salinestris]
MPVGKHLQPRSPIIRRPALRLSAAVVGVILNLALFFGYHVL